jgi:hypothetical protein
LKSATKRASTARNIALVLRDLHDYPDFFSLVLT